MAQASRLCQRCVTITVRKLSSNPVPPYRLMMNHQANLKTQTRLKRVVSPVLYLL